MVFRASMPIRWIQVSRFRILPPALPRWMLYGNWTMQIENDGNFEGEAANQPGNYSILGDRSEILGLERLNPVGRLNDFQRHKLRAWTSYELSLGKFGNAALGVLYRMDSPQTYSLTASAVPISSVQRSRDPGYARPPTSQTVYFGERGSQTYGNPTVANGRVFEC